MQPKALVACLLYAVAGPSIILLNKNILNTFPYPYTLTSMGLLCSGLIAFAFHGTQCGPACMERYGMGALVSTRPKMTMRRYCKSVVPIAACQALAMALGTSAYLSLTVAFIQMLKAFTPVITLGVLYALGVESPSVLTVVSVVGISFGTLLAVAGEVQFDWYGFIIHEVSAVSEAMRVVLTQKLLSDMKFTPIEGLYYMAPAGFLSMLVLVVGFELSTVVSTGDYVQLATMPSKFVGASLLGFALNMLTFTILQLTSSVLLKGIAVARTAGLVIFCAAFYGETVTSLEALGYTVSLASFVFYNYVRIQEADAAAAAASRAASRLDNRKPSGDPNAEPQATA